MATKKQLDEKKEYAKLKFITTTITAQELAVLCNVTPKTMGAWRKEGAWDELREANDTQPLLLIKKYLRGMDLINKKAEDENRELTGPELDRLSKLNKLVKDLRLRNTPQQVMEVMNEFNLYMADKDIESAQKVIQFSRDFVTKKIREAGNGR